MHALNTSSLTWVRTGKSAMSLAVMVITALTLVCLLISNVTPSVAMTPPVAVEPAVTQPTATAALENSAQRRTAWRKSRKAVLSVAKKEPNYTGYTVTKGGQGLRIYGTSKSSKAVQKAMKKATTASGLIVRWSPSADYTRKELRRAAKILAANSRVISVRLSHTEGGYLAVRFKKSVRLPKFVTADEFGSHFGVDVPVIAIADAIAAK